MDELSRLIPGLSRDHHREERIACDVEWDAEEYIAAPLIELAAKPAFRDVELEERMAGRESDLIGLEGIPSRDDVAASVWVRLEPLDELRDLIEAVRQVAIGPLGRAEIPPLVAVDRPEIALFAAKAGRLIRRRPRSEERRVGKE